MQPKSAWDIPYVICFLIGLGIVLVGIAATTFHVIGWLKTNQWHAVSNGEMMVSFGLGRDRTGWGALQSVVDWWWPKPFWAATLAAGVMVVYLPSLLRTLLGRRR